MIMRAIEVRQIDLAQSRADICDAILRALPDWFGIESSIVEYVRSVREMPLWAAFDGDEPVGFVALKRHTEFASEVAVMGVCERYHRRGIGRLLIGRCEEHCGRAGAKYLTVKTLDESREDAGYARTRQFYMAMGFCPIEVFPLLWDADNPCLMMVKSIEPDANAVSKAHWEGVYQSASFPEYDGWLDKHLPDLRAAVTIIDLGCGTGANALYLRDQGIDVTACDFSGNALSQLAARMSGVKTMCFDMSKGLPFADRAVDIVIADLSLHYFDWETTRGIVEDIFRVLCGDGLLLCRVNALGEYRRGEGDRMLEENYYFNGKNYKRYFGADDIQALFSRRSIHFLAEGTTRRYGSEKHLWEIAVRAT